MPRHRKSVRFEDVVFPPRKTQDEWEHGPFRARVSADSLDLLQVDYSYHQHTDEGTVRPLLEANPELFPPICLSVRGRRCLWQPGHVLLVPDPVFILDGRKRVAAAKMMSPRAVLHAAVFFGTDLEWERQFILQEIKAASKRLSRAARRHPKVHGDQEK
jgi:hypothetical protein